MPGIFIDGTLANDTERPDDNSNVGHLYRGYRGAKLYIPGIGTRGGVVGKILGGLFGFGGRARIKEACQFIQDSPRGPIDIVGWSRGGALAISLCNELTNKGYQVRFLGLLDPVASFGLPGCINLGYTLSEPLSASVTCVVAARDEESIWYPLVPIQGLSGPLRRVWVKGDHGEVGRGKAALKVMWLHARRTSYEGGARRTGQEWSFPVSTSPEDTKKTPSKRRGLFKRKRKILEGDLVL